MVVGGTSLLVLLFLKKVHAGVFFILLVAIRDLRSFSRGKLQVRFSVNTFVKDTS